MIPVDCSTGPRLHGRVFADRVSHSANYLSVRKRWEPPALWPVHCRTWGAAFLGASQAELGCAQSGQSWMWGVASIRRNHP